MLRQWKSEIMPPFKSSRRPFMVPLYSTWVWSLAVHASYDWLCREWGVVCRYHLRRPKRCPRSKWEQLSEHVPYRFQSGLYRSLDIEWYSIRHRHLVWFFLSPLLRNHDTLVSIMLMIWEGFWGDFWSFWAELPFQISLPVSLLFLFMVIGRGKNESRYRRRYHTGVSRFHLPFLFFPYSFLCSSALLWESADSMYLLSMSCHIHLHDRISLSPTFQQPSLHLNQSSQPYGIVVLRTENDAHPRRPLGSTYGFSLISNLVHHLCTLTVIVISGLWRWGMGRGKKTSTSVRR